MISIARYTGGSSFRVISSRNRNFLFGYHGGLTGRWYAEGWISTAGPFDTDWHLHVGTIEAKGGNPRASFWRDGYSWSSDPPAPIIIILRLEFYSSVGPEETTDGRNQAAKSPRL